MSEVLKLAYIGCGAIASHHLYGLKTGAPRTTITAAVDTDPVHAATIADETGARVFLSLDEALENGDFDAVDIMTPHHLHEPMAIACLEAGKHVLLEKPMAPTLDACDRILAAAAVSDKVFMVGENSQYWPEVLATDQLLNDGAIGDVISVITNFYVLPDDESFTGEHPWRFDNALAGGGLVIDGGAHLIRPLRMWFGEIETVIGAIDHPWKKMEDESLGHALLQFESGKIGTFSCLMFDTVLGPSPFWRITGTTGEIHVAGLYQNGVLLFDEQHPEGRMLDGEWDDSSASFIGEMADFEQAVLDGKPLAAGPEVSLGELRTALAIYRSAKTRQWEKVWE